MIISKKNGGLILALLLIAAGLVYLAFGKLEKNLVYFVTPSELIAKGPPAFNQPIRLGGTVKKGSIQWDSQKVSLEFLLTDGLREILVVSRETPPQMFQEEMGVVVEGRWVAGKQFQSERLMVKHSNEYHPPKAGEKPHILYKDLVQ